MFEKTEKKLENLDNDVLSIEAKMKEYAEKLRLKKEKREDTMKAATIELLRENNISLGDLKALISGNVVQTIASETPAPKGKRKYTTHSTNEVADEVIGESEPIEENPDNYGKETTHDEEIN